MRFKGYDSYEVQREQFRDEVDTIDKFTLYTSAADAFSFSKYDVQ